MDDLTRLSQGKYLSLTTFRKTGEEVATPVWVARDGDRLVVTTEATSGKAKRLRNSGRVLLAPCDYRGKLTGEQVPGTAVLLDEADSARVRSIVIGRNGLLGKAIEFVERFRGNNGPSVGIAITPGPWPDAGAGEQR